jgi:ribosomal protein L6P/L9E
VKNASLLKLFNVFDVKCDKNTVFICNKSSNQTIRAGKGIAIGLNRYFFKNKSEVFLFRSVVFKGIKKLTRIYFQKINLKGIGFKSYKLSNNLLLIKLGFTHKIYYINQYNNTNFICKKSKLLVYGGNIDSINKFSDDIKNFRKPDMFKGKGVVLGDKSLKLKSIKKRI